MCLFLYVASILHNCVGRISFVGFYVKRLPFGVLCSQNQLQCCRGEAHIEHMQDLFWGESNFDAVVLNTLCCPNVLPFDSR